VLPDQDLLSAHVLPDQDLLSADAGLAAGFGRARFLVLDEADRLLEKSFEGELAVIAAALPERRQTLLFSATLTRALALLQGSALRDAFVFQARRLHRTEYGYCM
jgi:ATP-dependent RNA helicase DDX49/DBP8